MLPPYVAQGSARIVSGTHASHDAAQRPRALLLYFRGSVLPSHRRHGWGVREWLVAKFGSENSSSVGPAQANLCGGHGPHRDILVSGGQVPLDAHTECLGRARFCFAPPGFQSWSAHLAEAVLAGCVPVVVRHGARLPRDLLHRAGVAAGALDDCITCPSDSTHPLSGHGMPHFHLPFESGSSGASVRLDYSRFAMLIAPRYLCCLNLCCEPPRSPADEVWAAGWRRCSESCVGYGPSLLSATYSCPSHLTNNAGVMDALALPWIASISSARHATSYDRSMRRASEFAVNSAARENAVQLHQRASGAMPRATLQHSSYSLPSDLPAVQAELADAMAHARRALELNPVVPEHHLRLTAALRHPMQARAECSNACVSGESRS